MNFLSDENIATSVVFALRNFGHNVFDVKEEKWHRESDKELVAYAKKKKFIILTHDKDFLDQKLVPVILLRFQDQKPKNVIRSLFNFLTNPKFTEKLNEPVTVVLSEAKVEFHHP